MSGDIDPDQMFNLFMPSVPYKGAFADSIDPDQALFA